MQKSKTRFPHRKTKKHSGKRRKRKKQNKEKKTTPANPQNGSVMMV